MDNETTVTQWLDELKANGGHIRFEEAIAKHSPLSPDQRFFLVTHYAEIGVAVTGKDKSVFIAEESTAPPASDKANLNDPKFAAPSLMGERLAFESRHGVYHQTPACCLGIDRATGESLGECTDALVNPDALPTFRKFLEDNAPAEIVEMFAFTVKIQRKSDAAIREWKRFSYDGFPIRKRKSVPYPGTPVEE